MSTPKPSRSRAPLLVLAALLALGIGGKVLLDLQARKRQERAAEEAFAPVIRALAPPAEAEVYDLDKTIQLVHDLDIALSQGADLGTWLREMARRDLRHVDPRVLGPRRELMRTLQRIYALQTEREEQEAMWSLTGELLLGTLSVVGGEGQLSPLGPAGSMSIDRDQARRLLESARERQKARLELGLRERALESELLDGLLRYAEAYHSTLEEWDRLCTLRDRAYLAIHNGEWAAAEEAAWKALQMAPLEREAHLLWAMARIEGGRARTAEDIAEVEKVLTEYVQRHPDRSAPALVLLGLLASHRGDTREAFLLLQQAATYYPRQADSLADMLDPYKMRGFLRKSREGSLIIQLYKATMLGAGYTSPDLQMARLLYAEGFPEGGRRKVLDHFSRRRAQRQWDLLLTDIDYAQDLLGADYRRIFPEDAFLDLLVRPRRVGSSLVTSVRNRSGRDLRNATLVLAIGFTDMHPDDYETFVAGTTQPVVPDGAETSFGSTTVEMDWFGTRKTVEDIVRHRAILITDEAVLWVDTDEYKIALDRELREGRVPRQEVQSRAAVIGGDPTDSRGVLASLAEDLLRESRLVVEPRRLFRDAVVIHVPRHLAVLRPVFRLSFGDQQFDLAESTIIGERIRVRFEEVGDFDPQGGNAPIQLVASTVLGELVWSWSPEAGNQFRLSSVDARSREP